MDWCDVVNVNFEIKAADNALVFIPKRNLFADELPHAAFPVPVKVGLFGVIGGKAKAITKIAFFDLAREAQDGLAAVGASCLNLVSSAFPRLKSLPLAVTFVVAASLANVLLGVLNSKRFAADGTAKSNVTAFVVSVMFASVLVKIQVSSLLARVLSTRNYLPATAGAIDDFRAGIFKLSGHLSFPIVTVNRVYSQDIIA